MFLGAREKISFLLGCGTSSVVWLGLTSFKLLVTEIVKVSGSPMTNADRFWNALSIYEWKS